MATYISSFLKHIQYKFKTMDHLPRAREGDAEATRVVQVADRVGRIGTDQAHDDDAVLAALQQVGRANDYATLKISVVNSHY